MKEISKRLKEMRLGNYFRELSIVIIGVAVTLYAGNAITGIKEKKDLERQLEAVYIELEENSKRLDPVIEFYKVHEELRHYLYQVMEHPESYSNDSIQKYRRVMSFNANFSYKHAAYDMFINSGAMKLMTDRKQLLEITESYIMLEEFKDSNDGHIQLKEQKFTEVYKMDRKTVFEKEYDIRNPEWNMEFNFHALNSGMEEGARIVKTELDKVLAKQKYTRK